MSAFSKVWCRETRKQESKTKLCECSIKIFRHQHLSISCIFILFNTYMWIFALISYLYISQYSKDVMFLAPSCSESPSHVFSRKVWWKLAKLSQCSAGEMWLSGVVFHRENGGSLGMGPLIINPIYTLYSGYLLGISPFKGLCGGLKQLGPHPRVPAFSLWVLRQNKVMVVFSPKT